MASPSSLEVSVVPPVQATASRHAVAVVMAFSGRIGTSAPSLDVRPVALEGRLRSGGENMSNHPIGPCQRPEPQMKSCVVLEVLDLHES